MNLSLYECVVMQVCEFSCNSFVREKYTIVMHDKSFLRQGRAPPSYDVCCKVVYDCICLLFFFLLMTRNKTFFKMSICLFKIYKSGVGISDVYFWQAVDFYPFCYTFDTLCNTCTTIYFVFNNALLKNKKNHQKIRHKRECEQHFL